MSDNSRIAKNTIYLYIRMFVTMLIALYTSRIILEKLGTDDYGIYQAVGGVVGLLAFLNSAIATGTSRFLTFELGVGDLSKLKKTFSSVLTAHIIIALLIWIISETVGLWFVYNKMSFPLERSDAAIIAYHISIFTVIITLIQVPYNASVISHERMGFYSIISILDAILKLTICYLINHADIDKLILYASLLLAVNACGFLSYIVYCHSQFKECTSRISLDIGIIKPILSFSGWSLFANGSFALSNQGILILLNMFFEPAVVAGRAISLQVISASNMLVNNFRLAVNPQVVKLYAVKDYQGSKKLLLNSTKLSYYLMLVVAVPMYYLIDPILHLWLGNNIPEYTALFIRLGIIQSLFQVFDTSFYTALYAKGRLKENALISPMLVFIVFPIIYVLFLQGFSPAALSWAYLFVYAILGLLVKPLLVIKIVDYTWSDILKVFFPCLMVSIIISILSFFIHLYIEAAEISEYIIELVMIFFITGVVCFFLGVERETRKNLERVVMSKLFSRKPNIQESL